MARGDYSRALSDLEQCLPLSKAAGSGAATGGSTIFLADIYKSREICQRPSISPRLAAASTQASGDICSVPERLQTLAEIEIRQGAYSEADRAYDRAAAFVDSSIGDLSGVLDKTALIKASSELYSQHFCLVAQHFNDPAKAFSIIEQVRGRVTTDLLMAGSITPAGGQERGAHDFSFPIETDGRTVNRRSARNS